MPGSPYAYVCMYSKLQQHYSTIFATWNQNFLLLYTYVLVHEQNCASVSDDLMRTRLRPFNHICVTTYDYVVKINKMSG